LRPRLKHLSPPDHARTSSDVIVESPEGEKIRDDYVSGYLRKSCRINNLVKLLMSVKVGKLHSDADTKNLGMSFEEAVASLNKLRQPVIIRVKIGYKFSSGSPA
jgi:hypothetical protein